MAGPSLWDQVCHIEPVGAITIPVTKKGKIRLQKTPRPVVLPSEIEPSFPETYPMENWGRWMVEVPRGFPIRSEKPEETALRETVEEAQSPVLKIRKIGEVNANSTFYVHMIPVFVVHIDEDWKGELSKDVNEKVIKGEDHEPEEIRRMIREGVISDGLTLAALNLYFCREGI